MFLHTAVMMMTAMGKGVNNAGKEGPGANDGWCGAAAAAAWSPAMSIHTHTYRVTAEKLYTTYSFLLNEK